jgi:hypothetical protein
MPIARQNPDVASNTNSGFYPAAISATMNAKSSSNQIYDTTSNTNSGFYPSATLAMKNTKSSNQLYDTAKLPSNHGSENGD